TAYALAWSGDLDLRGILIDDPRNIEKVPELKKVLADFADAGTYATRSPDVEAVAQLNYLTDKAVPVATGTLWPNLPGEKIREDNLPKDLRGVNMVLNLLRQSARPVAINVVGSCQDVAIAGKKEPRLFAEKCAGIYLNGGISSRNLKEESIGRK